MLIFLLLFIGASIIGIKVRKDKTSNDYLDKKTTGSICGFFVFIIFMSHITTEMGMDSGSFLDTSAAFFCHKIINQLMVVPFLFYSGYGVTYQYLTKKKEYLKTFLIKRFLKVYLFYVICLLIRQFSSFLVHGCVEFIFNPFELIFPSYWYMFVILVQYLITFLIFLIFKENRRAILCASIVASVILSLSLCLVGKETCWFDTTIAFSFGVFWALYRERLDQILMRKKAFVGLCIASIGSLCIFGAGGGFSYLYMSQFSYLVYLYAFCFSVVVVAFMLAILLFTFMFHYGNKMLFTIGLYTFHCYSLQRLTFEVFKEGIDILSIHPYLYFLCCLILTAVLSIIIKFLYDKFWKYTFNRINFERKKT